MSSNEPLFLLKLLRMAIGREKDVTLPAGIDWTDLLRLADRQGVSAIVADSISKANIALPSDVKFEWISRVITCENTYQLHEKTMMNLAELLREGGYKMMVLKGYGLSLNYPTPNHRPSGDLDIWMFGEEKSATSWLASNGIDIDNSHHHHQVFRFDRVMVESHYDFINVHTRPSSKRVEKRLKELAEKDTMKKDGIYYPSADFNALFLLRHSASHFASTEMSLRQMLDWGFFFEKHHEEINWQEYLSYIKKEGMYRFYNLLATFCIRELGFDAVVFHELSEDKLYRQFYDEIMTPSFSEHEDGSLLNALWVKPRRWWHNRWKNRLCFPDGLLVTFVNGIWAKLLKPSHFIH